MSFTAANYVGQEIMRPPISITLTSIVTNGLSTTFKSQFKAFSRELRNTLQQHRGSVEVSCKASASGKDSITLIVPGMSYILLCSYYHSFSIERKKPKIEKATLAQNELTVMWETKIYDIVAIVVIVENVKRKHFLLNGIRRRSQLLLILTSLTMLQSLFMTDVGRVTSQIFSLCMNTLKPNLLL